MSCVFSDKEVQELLKNMIYKTAITPAMTHGGECWMIRKCEQNRMNTTELKMLRRIQGKTRKYHIRNVIIRGNAHICPKARKTVVWFGHVHRRNDGNVAKSVLNTEIEGSRPRGRPKLRWMDRLKYMKKNSIRPDWASDRERWFVMIQYVNPTQETTER